MRISDWSSDVCSSDLWRAAAVSEIITDRGAVTGVVVRKDGECITVRAKRGVILASGGYGANQQMRRENVPLADEGWSLQPEGNEGDEIRLGERGGGTCVRDKNTHGIWAAM